VDPCEGAGDLIILCSVTAAAPSIAPALLPRNAELPNVTSNALQCDRRNKKERRRSAALYL